MYKVTYIKNIYLLSNLFHENVNFAQTKKAVHTKTIEVLK